MPRAISINYISYFKEDLKKKRSVHRTVTRKYQALNADRTGSANNILTGQCRGTELYSLPPGNSLYASICHCCNRPCHPTVAQTLAKIVTTMNRVNGVYEKEVSVRMILVATENNIIFTNAATDPFTGNNNGSTLIDESQKVIDSAIGTGNYDIGHTFSTGGGGVARLGVVCNASFKASGITGTSNPTGDGYDIDYVAHEMGHQFGANHPFNSVMGNCGGDNRNASTAYEPGSGTTIMAYAGICGTDNIQPNSDPFFHAISFDEISNYITIRE